MKPHSILALSVPKTSSAVSPEASVLDQTTHLRSGFPVKSPPIFHTRPPPPPPPYGVHISRCINMQRSLPRFRSAERFFSCKIHGKMFYPNSLCLIWRCHVSFSLWGMVQFGNPKPLRNNCHSGARVQIPASTPYMG